MLREWQLPDGLERVNVHGSGISLGHPIGATGGRIMTTLLRELRRRGGRYGLETMCIGGGQGMAADVREPHRLSARSDSARELPGVSCAGD